MENTTSTVSNPGILSNSPDELLGFIRQYVGHSVRIHTSSQLLLTRDTSGRSSNMEQYATLTGVSGEQVIIECGPATIIINASSLMDEVNIDDDDVLNIFTQW